MGFIKLDRIELYNDTAKKTDDCVLVLRLNKPEKANAFDAELVASFQQKLQLVQAEPHLRALVIMAEGKHFSAGADLRGMKESGTKSLAENQTDALRLQAIFQALVELPVPVLSIVKGACYGGANGICAASDYVIADHEARFALSEVLIGLVPAIIYPYLSLKMPLHLLHELSLSGRVFKAAEAMRAGLVQRIFGQDLDPEPLELLGEVLNSWLKASPKAQASLKALRLKVLKDGARAHEWTPEWLAQIRQSPEAQAGLTSFLNKELCPPWSRFLPSDFRARPVFKSLTGG